MKTLTFNHIVRALPLIIGCLLWFMYFIASIAVIVLSSEIASVLVFVIWNRWPIIPDFNYMYVYIPVSLCFSIINIKMMLNKPKYSMIYTLIMQTIFYSSFYGLLIVVSNKMLTYISYSESGYYYANSIGEYHDFVLAGDLSKSCPLILFICSSLFLQVLIVKIFKRINKKKNSSTFALPTKKLND